MSTKLNAFWLGLIEGALLLLQKGISMLIPEGIAREAWLVTLQPSAKIIAALRDDDPNDAEQLKAIVKQHTNAELVPFAQRQFENEILSKINDARLQSLISIIAQVPFAAAGIYTDNDPRNEAQIKTYLEQWVEDHDNQAVLLDEVIKPLLRALFKKNPWIADFIITQAEAQLQLINIDIDGDGL